MVFVLFLLACRDTSQWEDQDKEEYCLFNQTVKMDWKFREQNSQMAFWILYIFQFRILIS